MARAIYSEDGWKAEVEILEDNSDNEWSRYTLKVIRTLFESRFWKSPPDGQVFSVDQRKNAGAWGGMWHLYPETVET